MKTYRITFDKLIFGGQEIQSGIFDCNILPGEDPQEKAIEVLEARGIIHGNILSIIFLEERNFCIHNFLNGKDCPTCEEFGFTSE